MIASDKHALVGRDAAKEIVNRYIVRPPVKIIAKGHENMVGIIHIIPNLTKALLQSLEISVNIRSYKQFHFLSLLLL